MFDYTKIRTDHTSGTEARNTYFEGIKALIWQKAEESLHNRDAFMTPETLCADREGFRK